MTVHQYDIVLDVTVINRTSETLQNLCLELATMGDLKLVERPQNYTLSPQSSKTIRCGAQLGTGQPRGHRPTLMIPHRLTTCSLTAADSLGWEQGSVDTL